MAVDLAGSTGTGIRIGVLGPLAAWRDGESATPSSLGERTVLTLLAVVPGEYVTAAAIAGLLWPGPAPAGAAGLVHTYVSRLRTRLEPGRPRRSPSGLIASRSGTYRLGAGPGQLDVLDFREHVRRAQAAGPAAEACAAYADALALWRGEVAADVDLGGHPELTKLADERIAATLDHAELALASGRPRAALPFLRAAAALDPLHGAVQARLMLVLAALGQHAEALRVFDAVRARLRDDLGADPDPVLRDAHARVLAQGVPPGPPEAAVTVVSRPAPAPARADGPPAPHQLPARPALDPGHRDDLERIVQALRRPHPGSPVVVTIGGLPGVGKSAAALAAAHLAAPAFPDGELYASLAGGPPGVPPPAAADVLRGFLQALDPAAPAAVSDQAVLGQYRSLTAGRRLLVVLDGAVCAAQVRPLLPTGAGCAALVTSQETLASLDATRAVRLRPLAAAAALGLLAGLTAAGPAWEPAAAAQICAACGGLPLALRIVAAQLASRPAWSLADVAGRLAPEATRLAALHHGDLSVSARIQASYDALRQGRSAAGPDAARAFLRLGAARGLPLEQGIGLGQAAAVLGGPPGRCESALERLADAYLLDSPAPGTYQMHPLLRLGARDLTGARDLQAAAGPAA